MRQISKKVLSFFKRSSNEVERLRKSRFRKILFQRIGFSFLTLFTILFFFTENEKIITFLTEIKKKIFHVPILKLLPKQKNEIIILGRYYTSLSLISKIALQKENSNPFLWDLEDLKQKIEKISWIKEAALHRRLPNQLTIKLSERKPIALWRHQNKLFFIDESGVSIDFHPFPNLNQNHLISLKGDHAPRVASRILKTLQKFPNVMNQIKTLSHVRDRRWNILLKNKVVVKLPGTNVEERLSILSVLEQRKILSSVTSIDLRIEGKVFLTPKDPEKKLQLS